MALLEVAHVHTFYGESHILVDLSLEVAEGEVVCLLGRNGAGKSTTLKSIIGLAPPRSGRIRLSDHDVRGLPPFRVARLGIGYVPEDRRVFPNLTVRENLEVARKTWGDAGPNRWTTERLFELFPQLQERRSQRAGCERRRLRHLGAAHVEVDVVEREEAEVVPKIESDRRGRPGQEEELVDLVAVAHAPDDFVVHGDPVHRGLEEVSGAVLVSNNGHYQVVEDTPGPFTSARRLRQARLEVLADHGRKPPSGARGAGAPARCARPAGDPTLPAEHRRDKGAVDGTSLLGVPRWLGASSGSSLAPYVQSIGGTGEGHEPLEGAVAAAEPRKAVRQDAAREEIPELLLHELRQAMAIGVMRRCIQERLQMLVDHAVQHAVLDGTGLIPGEAVGHADDVGAVSGG